MYRFCLAIPAYNEEELIKASLEKTIAFCEQHFEAGSYTIVVADNNSKDDTASIVKTFLKDRDDITYLFVAQQGKGAAIRAAWNSCDAQHYVFMDADLATDLEALPRLLDKLESGVDVVYGSRYHVDSIVERTLLRKCISRGYRILLRMLLRTKIGDAPCGFKGISRKTYLSLLPNIGNTTWFFDSELVLRAEHEKYTVEAIPVVWKEPRVAVKTRLPFFSVALEYIKKVVALRKDFKQ